MPELMNLPSELTRKIWSYVLDSNETNATWESSINFDFSVWPERKGFSTYDRLSVLCVSKAVYAEAIEVYYETSTFWFCQAGSVAAFVTETLARENGRALLNRVKNIRLEFELWHEDLEGLSIDADYYIGWRELFGNPEYRLPSLFPGLKHLLLEFLHSESRFRTKYTPTKSVDQGNETFFELWDWMVENPLGELSVVVIGLSEPENERHMARDVMGLEYEEYVEPVDKTLEAEVE